MNEFTRKNAHLLNATLGGFDRLVFRGRLRTLSYVSGMNLYLSHAQVLLKDFSRHMAVLTDWLKAATQERARQLEIPLTYLRSPKVDKEEVARAIARERGITAGPICVLSTVEVFNGFEIRRDPDKKHIQLVSCPRKCLVYYHYHFHEQFGFMHARIHTWAPFMAQVCLNGREWLARQMDAQGLGYVRRDNCFTWLEDPQRAQELMAQQVRTNWTGELDAMVKFLNPVHEAMFEVFPIRYYWSTHQSEWATDLLFKNCADLSRLYPRLILHGVMHFGSTDVLRFLGRKTPATGALRGNFAGEVTTSLKQRPEGVRLKHNLNANSVKVYDKQGSVLRVETTINDARDIKVYRKPEGKPDAKCSWQKMRKSVADLERRTQVSQASNDRYLNALAAVSDPETLEDLLKKSSRRVRFQGKKIRPLHPWDPQEMSLLTAVNRAEFLITGFRLRDLAAALGEKRPKHPHQRRQQSAALSYRLRILRAHGLLKKLPRTHRYQVTPKGRTIITALIAAQKADTQKLADAAA